MHHASTLRRLPLALAIGAMLALSACGGSDHDDRADLVLAIPPAPADQGAAETVPVPQVTAFVDTAATNQRGDARYATLATNAGVRVLGGMLEIWKPLTEIVDAGVSAPAVDGFPAVVQSTWTGVPNDGSNGGTIVNATVHNANIDYVVKATTNRTQEQALQAYLDDRRNKGYSVTEGGMGPLTDAWHSAARQTTTITGMPLDATTVKYDDGGNNNGVGGDANADFGKVIDLVNAMGNNGSTEPAKRFYKYARPWRWSSAVKVVPQLEPAKSTTPPTDGGYTSGHAAEATRNAVAMAYVLPERYQQIVGRGLELGESRILAGMHSPLDVISGRVQAQAVAAANLIAAGATTRAAAVSQAHTTLMKLTSTTPETFGAYAAGTPANDRFADYATARANYLRRMTYGLPQIGATNAPAVVPKGAEVMLETRLPYLSEAQRRVVLKTTAIASGYPVLDDPEGWGRLNLFAAADGYGAFSGNVVVNMDASKGGFHAADRWRNDITGSGKLVKQGSGSLSLGGKNAWTGGTEIQGGTLQALSATAFGAGDVYVAAGGTAVVNAPAALAVGGKYTQLSGATLELRLGAAPAGRLNVTGAVTVGGGTLRVKFQDGYKPAVGDTLTVISAGSLKGKFETISVDGFTVTANYSATGLQLVLGK